MRWILLIAADLFAGRFRKVGLSLKAALIWLNMNRSIFRLILRADLIGQRSESAIASLLI